MSQLLEIEFKNLLTEEEYYKLLHYFNITEIAPIKQTNIYFDTIDLALKKQRAALRVRIKENTYEFTLKQKQNIGLLETTDHLNKVEFESLINSHIIPHKSVFRQLQLLNINKVYEIARLTTYRIEFSYLEQLISLDKSEYYNHFDYEIELETNHFTTGKQIFNTILQTNNIPKRKTINKIKRAYEYKKKKGY